MPDVELSVSGLNAWYGESHVLHGMEFSIGRGEIVTLLGRNGAGKTTTMKAIMGMMAKRSGSVAFKGRELIQLRSDQIARLGIALCPDDRGIFSTLSVFENLTLPPIVDRGGIPLTDIYRMFPNLSERTGAQGTKLSGGEQQMLAIARILRTGATLLLLDEPTEGLAPVVVQKIGKAIRALKERGYTILLVEQNFRFASELADRHYFVEHGLVVDSMSSDEIVQASTKLQQYLGV